MTKRNSRWSDVVGAYEESLDLLEAARAEYADAVKKTIDELRDMAEKRLTKMTLAEGVKRTALERTKDEPFAQECLYCSLSCDEIEWAVVHAWVAAPYGGPLATLRVGVEIKRPETLVWDRPWLENQMKGVTTDLRPCDLGSLSSAERSTDDWAWMTDVDLTAPASAELGAAAFVQSVEAAATLAGILADAAEPVRMALGAVRELRRRLEKNPLVTGQKLEPKSDLGRSSGTRWLSLTPADVGISVWVTIDLKDQTVLYGHGYDDKKLPQLAARMSERLGVGQLTHGGYPSGLLLNRRALAGAGQAAIIARCMEALRAFVELTSKA